MNGTVPRDWTLLARAIGVIVGVGSYLWLRSFFSFKGMYRSYDILTAAVIGSLAGAGLAIAITRGNHGTLRYRWAFHSLLLLVPAAILYLADKWGHIGVSVRLSAIALLATYEAGAPGTSLGQRSFFLLLPVLGALAHAYLFTERYVTAATLESIGAGVAGGLLVLASVYRPQRSPVDPSS